MLEEIQGIYPDNTLGVAGALSGVSSVKRLDFIARVSPQGF